LALETHSVELELLTQDFVNKIKEAQKNLDQVAESAARAGQQVGENLGAGVAGAETPISNVTNSFRKLLTVITLVGGALVAAGGIVVGFEAVRIVLGGLLNANPKVAAQFAKLSKSINLASGELAGFASRAVGTRTTLGKLLASFQRTTIAASNVTTGVQGIIATSGGFRTFATATFNAMNSVRGAAVNLVVKGLDRVAAAGPPIRRFGKGITNAFRRIAPAAGRAARLIDTVERNAILLGSGVTGLIPGLRKFVIGLGRVGLFASAAAAGLGEATAAAAAFQITATAAVATIVGFNAILLILGITLTAVGRRFLRFSERLAVQASEATIAFRQLEFSFEALNKQSDGALGTLDNFNKFIKQTSKETGAAVTDVAAVANQFLLLQPTIKLSNEALKEVITDTIALGLTTGDLARSLLDVKDAFLKQPGPLRRFVGVETAATEVEERLAKDIEFRAKATRQATSATKEAIKASAIQIIINEGLAARTQIVTEKSVSLVIEQRRLKSAVRDLGREFGESAEPILIRITNLFRFMVEVLSKIPKPIKAVVTQLITFSGVLLTATGLIIKFGTVIVIISSLGRILNAILAIQVKTYGTVGKAITILSKKVLGLNIVLGTTAGNFSALGTIVTEAFKKLAFGLNKVANAFLFFGASSAVATGATKKTSTAVALLGNAVKGLFTRILPLAALVTLAALKFIIIGAVLAAVFIALKELDQEFLLFERFIKPVTDAIVEIFDAFGGFEKIVIAAAKVFRGFIDLLKIGTLVLVVGFTATLIALGGAALLAADTIEFFRKKLGFLGKVFLAVRPGGQGLVSLFKDMIKKTDEASESLDDSGGLRDNLDKMTLALFDQINALTKASGKFGDFGDGTKTAGEIALGTKKSLDELSESAEVLEAVFELALDGINTSLKGVGESLEEQNNALDRSAQVEARFINASIKGETKRQIEISKVNRRVTEAKIKNAQEAFERESELIGQRLDLELSAFNILENKDKLTVEGRIKRTAELVKESTTAQKEITEKAKQSLEKQLSDLDNILDRRAALILNVENRIRNIQLETESRIFNIQLKNLNAEQQNTKLRERAEEQLSQSKKALNKGDFELADKLAKQADATFQRITQAEGETQKAFGEQQIADLEKVGAARTKIAQQQKAELKAAQELDQELRQQLVTVLEELTEKFEKLAKELRNPIEVQIVFSPDSENIKRAKEQLEKEGVILPVSFDEASVLAATGEIRRIIDAQGNLAFISVGIDEEKFKQELTSFKNQAATRIAGEGANLELPVVLKLAEGQGPGDNPILKFLRETEQASRVIFTNIPTGLEPSSVAELENDLFLLTRDRKIRVVVETVGKVNPIVPINEMGAKITEIIQKGIEPITATIGSMVAAAAPAAPAALMGALQPELAAGGFDADAGVGAEGPTQTIRVDIKMEEGQFPVDVADQESADNLVAFTKTLKTLRRTRGNFRSPTSRGS